MNDVEFKELVEKNLAFLRGRCGFDEWWQSIRSDDREELEKKWANYLQKEVAPRGERC